MQDPCAYHVVTDRCVYYLQVQVRVVASFRLLLTTSVACLYQIANFFLPTPFLTMQTATLSFIRSVLLVAAVMSSTARAGSIARSNANVDATGDASKNALGKCKEIIFKLCSESNVFTRELLSHTRKGPYAS